MIRVGEVRERLQAAGCDEVGRFVAHPRERKRRRRRGWRQQTRRSQAARLMARHVALRRVLRGLVAQSRERAVHGRSTVHTVPEHHEQHAQ